MRKHLRTIEKVQSNINFDTRKMYSELKDLKHVVNTETDWNIDTAVESLCNFIQAMDEKKIISFLKYTEACFNHSPKNPCDIRQKCLILMIELRVHLINKMQFLKNNCNRDFETLDAIMEQKTLGEIIETMTQACLRLCRKISMLSADSTIKRILLFIQDNYNENLKLKTLGQLFYCNSAYLGKRFKEHTGKSFNTYLDIIRIDAAKELLRTTNMKVYEIAVKTGYANIDYFYSKFKKLEGMSPLDYRALP